MKKGFLAVLAGLFAFLPAALSSASSTVATKSTDIADPADGFTHLWHEVLVDITVVGVIFALIAIYFLIKYRRKSEDQVGDAPTLSPAAVIGWALIPAFAFMADDFYLALKGWDLWNVYRIVPEEREEVKVEAMMWSWNFTYSSGNSTTDVLFVPKGTPVLARMTSVDTLHSMWIPKYKVKEDCMPGRVTYEWFYPKESGSYILTCAEYCGFDHSGMYGYVVVLDPREYTSLINDADALEDRATLEYDKALAEAKSRPQSKLF